MKNKDNRRIRGMMLSLVERDDSDNVMEIYVYFPGDQTPYLVAEVSECSKIDGELALEVLADLGYHS